MVQQYNSSNNFCFVQEIIVPLLNELHTQKKIPYFIIVKIRKTNWFEIKINLPGSRLWMDSPLTQLLYTAAWRRT